MDHVESAFAPENGQERILSALHNGVIVVDADGRIAWMDEATRRRVNGGLQDLALPIARTDGAALDCFISAVDATISGERSRICVIQEAAQAKEPERDLIAAIQAVMADTSWFTRTVIDKVRALRLGNLSDGGSDVNLLSDREREVLGLICEGKSDANMSDILRLSPNTVRNHIMALYRKIGVNRRTAAIIWARERGITCLRDVSSSKRRASQAQHAGDQRK